MLKTNLLVANPYNDKHISLYDKFENYYGLEPTTSTYLRECRSRYTLDEYAKITLLDNEVSQNIFILDNEKIQDSCYIHGERDIKICNISFAPIKGFRNRKLIDLAIDYAKDCLGMKEIFIMVKNDDSNLKKELEKRDLENIDEEDGITTFLKEIEYDQNLSKVNC